jgi:hypothetical protein
MTVCFKERQGTNSSRSVTESVDESRKGRLTGAARSILAFTHRCSREHAFSLAVIGPKRDCTGPALWVDCSWLRAAGAAAYFAP